MHSLESTITICIQSSVNSSILNQPTGNDCEHLPGHSFGLLCGENLPIWRTCFPAGLIVPTITSRDSRNISNKNNLTSCVCVCCKHEPCIGGVQQVSTPLSLGEVFPQAFEFFLGPICLSDTESLKVLLGRCVLKLASSGHLQA